MSDQSQQIQIDPDALINKIMQQIANAVVTIAKMELALEQVTAERDDLLAIVQQHNDLIKGTGLDGVIPSREQQPGGRPHENTETLGGSTAARIPGPR